MYVVVYCVDNIIAFYVLLVHFTSSNEAHLGKVVIDAKTMLIRIHINSNSSGQIKNNKHAIDMINVVFFPDNIPDSGRPGK